MPDALLTRKQAADRLGISLVTLDQERAQHRLTYIQAKPGGKVWISEAALEEYLARSTHRAVPEPEIRETYRHRRKNKGAHIVPMKEV